MFIARLWYDISDIVHTGTVRWISSARVILVNNCAPITGTVLSVSRTIKAHTGLVNQSICDKAT